MKSFDIEKEEAFYLEQKVIEVLKTIYDPEIPVNIYVLGLIYKIDILNLISTINIILGN